MVELPISTKNCIGERDGNVLIVTLNRPEARNAFTPAMLVGLYRAWRLLDDDDELYCAILTARGETFCAGMDLKAGTEGGDDEGQQEIEDLMKEVTKLHWQALMQDQRHTKPLLKAVEGYDLAGDAMCHHGSEMCVSA